MQPAVQAALDGFPYELVPIVVGYADDLPHTWHVETPDLLVPISFNGNEVSTGDNAFYRIVSEQSITTGPFRWRIQTTIGPSIGRLSIGLTAATVGRRCGKEWKSTASADDLLLSIHAGGSRAIALHNEQIQILPAYKAIAATDQHTMTVEVDMDNRILRFLYQDNNYINRDIRIAVPPSMQLSNCRPCIIVYGNVIASILAWSAERRRRINDEPAVETAPIVVTF